MHRGTSSQSNIANQLERARQIRAMRKAFSLVKKRQRANAGRISDLEGRKKQLRRTREASVGNRRLLDKAIESLRQNGIKVQLAHTREEAISLVMNELAGNRLLVKSKSNVTKEIGLTKALTAAGIEVIETDIGDRILQLCDDVPSHPTGPASHLTRHEIADVLSAHFGKRVEPKAEAIVGLLREEISTYLDEAAVGITGANAVAAEEGAVLLVHNEGNIFEVATRPEKHIVLAGIDKVYPCVEEALNMVKLQTFYATGSVSASFINIISGPSQTADIEKQLIKGVHGAREICLILVDNHRSNIADSEYRELLYCIGCGQCLLICPAYTVYGSSFGLESQLGGRGVVYSLLTEQVSAGTLLTTYDSKFDSLDMCLSCRKCQRNCPLAIDTPSIITKLRLQNRKPVLGPYLQIAHDFINAHIKWIGTAIWLESLLLVSSLVERGKA